MADMPEVDDDFREVSHPAILRRPKPRRSWPTRTVFVIAALGLVIGLSSHPFLPLFPPVVPMVAYGVLLVAGSVLLFIARVDSVVATRRLGGSSVVGVSSLERAAVIALLVACLATGVVIAWELASWDWGLS